MTEIERKWIATIADEDGYRGLYSNKIFFLIEQYYILITDDAEVRLRYVFSTKSQQHECFLTRKVGRGMSREESEFEIPYAIYMTLKKIAMVGNPIIKRRIWVPVGSVTLEIDKYTSPLAPNDKVVLEVEFENEKSANDFDETILKMGGIFEDIIEKTNDGKMKNKNIALDGWGNIFE